MGAAAIVAVSAFNLVLADDAQFSSELVIQNIEAMSQDDAWPTTSGIPYGNGACWSYKFDMGRTDVYIGTAISCHPSSGTCVLRCTQERKVQFWGSYN